jgi:hypothetical protein
METMFELPNMNLKKLLLMKILFSKTEPIKLLKNKPKKHHLSN